MKIIVKDKNKIKISLFVPLFLIKSKLLFRLLFLNGENDIDKTKTNQIYKMRKTIYKEIKKSIKTQGHYYLIDIESQESAVKIKL